MKTTLVASAVAALALAISASAHAERRDFPVNGITGVASSIRLDLEIVQGDRESLSLEGDADQLAQVEAVMDDGVVRIRKRDRDADINWKTSVRGVLHTRRMDSIVLAGAGSMRSAAIRAETLRTSISGAGKIVLRRLDARAVNVAISGSGAVDLGSGRVEQLEVAVTGAGDVVAGKLRLDGGKVTISGVGSATLWPEKTLAVRITGVGSVRYYGDPQITDRHVVGIGNMKRMPPALQ